jgi:NAD+ kinase
MDNTFEDAVQCLVKLQNDHLATERILQAENERLKQRIHDLERKLNYSNAAASAITNNERPSKMLKALSASLHPISAVQRLVATASPRPPYIPEDDLDDDDEDDDDDASEILTDSNPVRDGKARFRLIAHSGDEREQICPKSKEITIPVLVKSYVEFAWRENPQRALLMVRPGDDISLKAFNDIAQYLWARNVKLLVETGSEVHLPASRSEKYELAHAKHEDLHRFPIDFIITLGGDGTFIRAAYAFPRACPPILAFAFGSLGFLTPFPASSINESLNFVMEGGFGLRLRARLEVELRRKDNPEVEVFQVLNECVVDRGATSSLVRLILYSSRDGTQPVTIVQGDGLIVATPTGSTAYSLSAGGSMVHPSVPAILVTPICPHSLSFRPILVPDSATLRVQVAPDARNSAWLSIDGRKSIELRKEDEFIVRFSSYPVPAVMARRTNQGDSDGWLSSLRSALNWNVIQIQKPLNIPKLPVVNGNT